MVEDHLRIDSTYDGRLAAWLAADRKTQFEICAVLEAIADSLPRGADRKSVGAVLAVVAPSWSAHRSFQEEALFPLLRRRHEQARPVLLQLRHLEREHVEIGGLNDEVADLLGQCLAGSAPNPDMLGYLLRNAFESRRRHVEWEKAVFEPLLPKVLAPVERTRLDAWLRDHCLPTGPKPE